MKLAVLVSGQWRNCEENIANWSEILCRDGIQFKVFATIQRANSGIQRIITPSNVGNKFFFHLSPTKFKTFNHSEITDEIVSSQSIFDKYELTEIDASRLQSCERLAVNENLRVRQIHGSIMYSGMERVYGLARSVMFQEDYTHFLRLRCDFRFNSFDLLRALKSHQLFFVGETLNFDGFQVGDQCFGGEIRYMERMMKTGDQISKLITSCDWTDAKESTPFAENLMHRTMLEMVDCSNIGYFPAGGGLVRPRLKFELKFDSWGFIKEVVAHNFRVLKDIMRSSLSKLSRS